MDVSLDTREAASKATRNAAIAGVVSAALTVGVIVLTVSGAGAPLGGLFGLWALIDVAVILALSYGTYRKSRASAVALLVYYLVNQVALRVDLAGEGFGLSGLGVAVVFVLLYVQGVRGAFAYHRLSEEQDPPM